MSVTDQELRDLVAQLARSHVETERVLQQTAEQMRLSQEETERVLQQTAEQMRLSQEETERVLQRTAVEHGETERVLQQTAVQLRLSKEETDRQLRELGKQIGGLGEKFGSFTEGMAYPSLKQILTRNFGATYVSSSAVKRRREGKSLEIDVFGYANTDKNEAYVVEVKSHLREEGIVQLLNTLAQFPEFFPEHRDKKLYGILAAVAMPEDLAKKVLDHGIYLARMSGDSFELAVPDDFQPHSFQ